MAGKKMTKTHRTGRARRVGGVTLIEVLVAAMLLILSVVAIAQVWKLSRHLTESSRDWAEYYAVARQEVELGKQQQFQKLFIVPSSLPYTLRTDYDQTGTAKATNLASGATATGGAYYRAVSTYTLTTTGAETESTRKLGVQQIWVYRIDGTTVGTTPVYQTTVFYTAPGV